MTAPQNETAAVKADPQPEGPTRGQRIDELAAKIPNRTRRMERLQAEIDEIRKARSQDAVDLAEILGSTGAAAAMLGITGRQFASLRGRPQ